VSRQRFIDISVEHYCHNPHRQRVGNKEQAASQAVCFLGFLLDHKDGYSMYPRNVGEFYRTRRTYTHEDSIFHSDKCENLKSNRKDIVSSVSSIMISLLIKLWELKDVEQKQR
jgi:hypothetical protein